MWSDYAFCVESKRSIPFTLDVVYAVDADPSFDAMKLATDERRRAIIRSVGGEGELLMAPDERLDLRSGTVVLLDFNRVRRYKPRADSWRFWYYEFDCDEEPALPLGRAVDAADPARDEADGRECLEALRLGGPASAAYSSALFGAMVHRWAAAWEAGARIRHPREEKIREAVTVMRRDLGSPLSVPKLASKAGMSERAFRDAFELVMDSPPKRYLDRLRLEKGAELLRLNRSSIAEIADLLGYSSAFHFSRAFRELFGVPPSTYASVLRSER